MASGYLSANHTSFPACLGEVKPRVKGLWYHGNIELLQNDKVVAIVGSRRMSRYGVQVLQSIVPRLVVAGYTTVSGMMYGIDTEVHRLTMENGGKTIAVLGYGIEREDRSMGGEIASLIERSGLILSEYEGQTRGQTWTFPQRNRIVVALSRYVIVVEAGVKSGSLNSASWARRMGKTVYSVPGSIFSATSAGTNQLIVEGKAVALSMTSFGELIGEKEQDSYSEKERKNRLKASKNTLEGKIVAQLKHVGPQSVNNLARATGYQVGEVSFVLMSLLLSGVVREERGVWGVV